MPGSGYQVENVLAEFWRQRMPGFGNPDDQLQVSEEGFQLGRERGNGRQAPLSGWAQPTNILDRIADTSKQSPEVEYEQQRRFGRFLVPVIISPNPQENPFPQVQDHVGTFRKSLELPEVEAVSAEAVPTPSAAPAEGAVEPRELILEPDLALLTPEIEVAEPSAADAMFAEERKPTEAEAEAPPAEAAADEPEPATEAAEAKAEAEPTEVADEEAPEPEPAPADTPSAAALLDTVEDEVEDDEDDFEEGLKDVPTDETDVVFGTGQITRKATGKFVGDYPDSALRCLLRRNLDGRPLPSEFEMVHEQWTERGLTRGRIKRHILDLMKWEDIPDLPIHELLRELRGRLYALSQQKS